MTIDTMQVFRVIGLRNEFATLDTSGIRLFEQEQCSLEKSSPHFSWMMSENEGLDLFELLIDCDKAILIDSVYTGKEQKGFFHDISLTTLDQFPIPRLTQYHGIHLSYLLELGTIIGYHMPQEIHILGIERAEMSPQFENDHSTPVSWFDKNALLQKIQFIFTDWCVRNSKNRVYVN